MERSTPYLYGSGLIPSYQGWTLWNELTEYGNNTKIIGTIIKKIPPHYKYNLRISASKGPFPPTQIFSFETCSDTNVCCCAARKGRIAVQGYWPACLWMGSSSHHLLAYSCASMKARIWHITVWPTFPKTD